MKKFTFQIFITLFVAIFLAQCTSEKFPGFEESPEGVFYKVHYRGNNAYTPHDSDWFKIRMDYRLEDTVLYSSSNRPEDMLIPNLPAIFKGDLYDGLKMMGDGDSMSFAVVADSFFLNAPNMSKLPSFVVPGSPMYFDVKLIKRYSNEEYKEMLVAEEQAAIETENENIQKYLQANNITVEPLASGLYFLPLKEGQGKRPDTGEMCKVFMEVTELGGGLLFSNFGKDPFDIEYGKGFDTPGFRQGLGMLRVGGKADLIVPSSAGIGAENSELIKAYTTLLYTVELVGITSVEQVTKERAEKERAKEAEIEKFKNSEPDRIQTYLKQNKITEKPDNNGLYIVHDRIGIGNEPGTGDLVKINYTLYNLDGEKLQSTFDNNKPYEFVVGQGKVIPAFELAIVSMKPGGSARVIVPSKLAYGAAGRSQVIPPYSPLVYNIELLEVIE